MRSPVAPYLSYAISLQRPPEYATPLFPLYYFERPFVVDLQAQIFKPDGQIPTVYPPRFFGLEFTEKIACHEALAISLPIGVYRLDRAPRA
jgi:hypothetical protein